MINLAVNLKCQCVRRSVCKCVGGRVAAAVEEGGVFRHSSSKGCKTNGISLLSGAWK